MKKVVLLLLVFVALTSYSQEKLTNQSIIELVDLGFDGELIISKIINSDVEFNTSIEQLKILKKSNVPNEVIKLMMNKSKSKVKTGIYFSLGEGKLKKIEPTVFSGSSSNNLLSNLTYGLGASKSKSYLPNKFSTNILDNNNQEFIFQLTEKENSAIDEWWFGEATSPNQFVLIKLKVKERKNRRELVTGQTSIGNNQTGISTDGAVQLKIENIGQNKFKVSTNTRLEKGEYCFFYQGTVPNGYNNQTVFDFSIR